MKRDVYRTRLEICKIIASSVMEYNGRLYNKFVAKLMFNFDLTAFRKKFTKAGFQLLQINDFKFVLRKYE